MSASSPNNGLCAICSDKATGKHYGASSCDGCKGFFRRSVRKNHVYQCRFVRSCHVDKDKRNQCRYCRLKKCFRAGMKKEAVQNERDRISVRRTPYDDQQRNSALSVATLYNADAATKSMLTQITTSDITRKALANVGDICESMKQQVMKMIDWAKLIPPFNEMDTDDKVSLLRSHACEHLLLSLARRSCMYNETLLLSNDTVITRTSLDNEQNKITCRIMDELIQPMRDIQMDESEFACLLAIILFDPSSRNLTISHRIRSLRWQVQVNLEDYINDRQYDSRGRFGEMLLLLQNLQTIAFQVIEQINAYRLYAGLKLDTLLLEMILQGSHFFIICVFSS
ncbi:hypothetical protein HELRODRAFT_67417 [Helobdella robusta]|uniref:Uncharacterized protein n=1 Tax=Helobdella robusta TaxID=6412 RepID=T1FZ05_HELRO|nr:hypothetical protein HELRODRAFT_67417 [Helobdella robusta]ESN99036.1 hypothetical protein HELRODRAFT_67417 [Helobdella robusta]